MWRLYIPEEFFTTLILSKKCFICSPSVITWQPTNFLCVYYMLGIAPRAGETATLQPLQRKHIKSKEKKGNRGLEKTEGRKNEEEGEDIVAGFSHWILVCGKPFDWRHVDKGGRISIPETEKIWPDQMVKRRCSGSQSRGDWFFFIPRQSWKSLQVDEKSRTGWNYDNKLLTKFLISSRLPLRVM